ncbi:hypothetical protein [Cohnella silvisoli]|uniref:Uncharacterized protein n=1 Tax=Cohnella silvisoli TaxID=2873699 RepID=A0ABV1KSC7_9BACL|nr:hypothetical protein [Cohnella silvisoli]MCD9021236.1 hypothetical protein [Cohnella silvisoli]
MKIGTFVIGGLAGAAVVLMIQRNQMMSAVTAGVGQNLKHRMNMMKDDAIEKALNMKFASSFRRSADIGRKTSKSSSMNEVGLGDVEKLIAQDEDVSHEVNSILEQNGQHRI